MKNIWKKHKLKMIVVAYFIGIFLVAQFVIRPMVGKTKDKADDIQKKLIDMQEDKGRLDKIPEMKDASGLIQEKKESLDVILVSEKEVDFIKKLESLADETGNKIALKIEEAVADPKKANDKKKPEEKGIKDDLSHKDFISMQINLKGNYASLVNFIKKLENFTYYVNIVSLDIKKEKEVLENKISSQPSSEIGVFHPVSESTPKSDQEKVEKKEKEILNSVLYVVIYIKK